MELASILIALGSLVVAGLALLHTYRASAGNARAIEQETNDRREQLELLRQQVETDAAALHDQRRAYIVASQRGSSGGPQDVYEFLVANAGWFPAREVIGIIENETGDVVAEARTLHLPVGGQDVIRIEVPAGALNRPKIFYLTLKWTDATGGVTARERVLEIAPVR